MVARMRVCLAAAMLFAGCSGCAASVPEAVVALQSAPPPANPVTATANTDIAEPASAPSVPHEFQRPAKIEYRELTIKRSSRADTPQTVTVEAEEIPEQPTKILDPAMAERLFGNTGITVQWIGWEERGPTWVSVDENGYWMLLGGQKGENGAGLDIEGFITEIGPDYFLYDGTIKIFGAPYEDRLCNVSKRGWRFGITQNRKYWRLREFEWCDRLTDYVDIYF